MAEPALPERSAARRGVLSGAALVAFGLALGVIAAVFWPRAAAGPAARATPLVAEILAPPNTLLAFTDGFDLSPDGSTLAFAARNNSDPRQVWLRPLDADTSRPIAGTENGVYPFWSPDGRSVAFFADNKLKRVNVDGSGLQTICDVPPATSISGSWGTGGDILWATQYSTAAFRYRIFRVPAGGGTPVALQELGEGLKPHWLPDGRRFLYAGGNADDWGIKLADVDGSAIRHVMAFDAGPGDGDNSRSAAAWSPSTETTPWSPNASTSRRACWSARRRRSRSLRVRPKVGSPCRAAASASSPSPGSASLLLVQGLDAILGKR